MDKYYLLICVVLVSLGGLLAGYDTGVISGALLFIKEHFALNSLMSGLLVGSVSLGAVIGALINGILADIFGRKKILIILSVIFILATIGCSFSQNALQLIISRVILGFGVGVVSFVCPLYLSEISPKEQRGRNVSFYQLAITFGILFSYIVNYFSLNSSFNWRLMLFLGVAPAIVMFLGVIFINDTPRWLISKNKLEEARKVLAKTSKNIDKEIEEIKEALKQKTALKFSKKIISPFIIALGIMFAQIATGINAIIYYAPMIFKNLGFYQNQQVFLFTIFIGLINFLMTFVAIIFVDKIGRKPLLYIGLSGMMISLLILSFVHLNDIMFLKYFAVIASGCYIIFFSMSLGPIALLLISEVFPLEYRAGAMSFAIVFNFILNFIVTSLFPIFLDKLGGCYTFLIFAIICLISIIFIYFFVPETKNRSLEEIEKDIH